MRYLNTGFASALLLLSPMSPVWLQGKVVQAQTVQDREAEASILETQSAEFSPLIAHLHQIAPAQTQPILASQVGDDRLAQLYGNNQKLALYKVASGLVVTKELSTIEKLKLLQQELESLQLKLDESRRVKNQNNEAEILNRIGVVYVSLRQFEEALESSRQALTLYKQLKNQEGEFKTLANIATIYFKFGKPQNSEQIIRQTSQDIASKKDKVGNEAFIKILRHYLTREWRFSAGVGEVSDRNLQEDYMYGEISWQEVLDLSRFNLFVARLVENSNQEIESLHGIGWAYRNLGKFPDALDYYNQAVAIAKLRSQKYEVIFLLVEIGIVYSDLGQYDKALGKFQLSLSESSKIEGKVSSSLLRGFALTKIGMVYISLNQYGEALKYLQEAENTIMNFDSINVFLGLGIVYSQQGKYSEALKNYQSALGVKTIGDPSAKGEIHNRMGLLYIQKSDYLNALDSFQKALLIFKKLKNSAGEAVTLSNIGLLLERQGKSEIAITFYKESVNTSESIRQKLRRLTIEEQKIYAATISSTYRSLADLLIQQGRLPEAQAVLELLKLRELRDFTRDAGIDSPGINLANVEATALKQILQRYTTIGAFSQKIDACEQTHCPELKQLRDQREQLNQAVTTELTQQRAILTKYFATESATLTPDNLTPEARDIVNAQPGTILIYPLILKTKIQFLIALKAGDGAVILRPVETPNVSAETLFKTIQTFREQLQTPTNLAALKATSQQLYTWLIKPLEPELNNPAIKHLVFAPDSTTRYIPLAALFDGKRYLIERFSISTITAASETDTSETFAELPVNDRFLLATGASTFANANPLENVPAELNAIVKPPNSRDQQGIYPGAELLNTQFDFEALKANLKGHRVLHIATHGSFQPGRVEDSYLLSGRNEKLTTALINQLGQYGLKGIHLVVLSACETAVGDRASDGIEIPGISYFFLKNKVKAVMASLWSVNDASTSLMMQQFYKQLATGKTTKAEALQLVQQQFIAGKLTAKDAPSRSPILIPKDSPQTRQSSNGDFSHPFYWAPFILIGNSL